MFNNKYNPDVLNNYSNLIDTYDASRYELKNEPYNLIISDKKNLDSNKFNIELNENKVDINNEFEKLLDERKIKNKGKLSKKNIEDIRSKFKLKNTELFNNQIDVPEDFEDIKDNFASSYKEQEKELKKGRKKFNNILDSLLEEGLLE